MLSRTTQQSVMIWRTAHGESSASERVTPAPAWRRVAKTRRGFSCLETSCAWQVRQWSLCWYRLLSAGGSKEGAAKGMILQTAGHICCQHADLPLLLLLTLTPAEVLQGRQQGVPRLSGCQRRLRRLCVHVCTPIPYCLMFLELCLLFLQCDKLDQPDANASFQRAPESLLPAAATAESCDKKAEDNCIAPECVWCTSAGK